MASNNIKLNIMTYNLHGFNQGSDYLKEVCEIELFDILFIQEHWLTPDFMCKLDTLSVNYKVFGKSAMELTMSTGFLRGRPFGGVAVIIKKQFCHIVQKVFCEDRYVILFANKYTIISKIGRASCRERV